VHILIAAQIGYEAPSKEKPEELTADDLLEMFPMPA